MEKLSQRLNAASTLWQLEHCSSFGTLAYVLCDLGTVNTPFWAGVSAFVK